ncbi:amastin-like surface protein-like protein [Angomonas deanei]|nr:amastin-like surface protein-like protein [Angomonas deanei]|eukprot:EPY19089.1 amastin-like surface protein-like protein [Angomonas deanei]
MRVPAFVATILFAVWQFIALVLLVVGIPLPQFDGGRALSASIPTCINFFGTTKKCNGLDYWQTSGNYECKTRGTIMIVGGVFAIISAVLAFIAFIFGILMVANCSCMVCVPFVFVILTLITGLVSWAMVVSTKFSKMCGVGNAKIAPHKNNSYGAGFGLIIAGWVVEVICLGILISLVCCC